MPSPSARFNFTLSHPGVRAGRGQTYACLEAFKWLNRSPGWPRPEPRRGPSIRPAEGPFSTRSRFTGVRLYFAIGSLGHPDEALFAIGQTAMGLLQRHVHARGCMDLHLRIEIERTPMIQDYLHIADIELNVGVEAPRPPPDPWIRPLPLPLDVEIPAQLTEPAARLHFRPEMAQLGDRIQTYYQTQLLQTAIADWVPILQSPASPCGPASGVHFAGRSPRCGRHISDFETLRTDY